MDGGMRRWWAGGLAVILSGTGWAQDDAAPAAEEEVATSGAETVTVEVAEVVDPGASERLRELRTVEEAVQDLKQRTFRSKATLQLLRELVIEGSTLGAGVEIWHVDELPRSYIVESVQYYMDGRSIYTWSDESAEPRALGEVQIRDQTVSPGPHTLQVSLMLRGNGGGVFGYVQKYRFKVQSSHTFEVEDGQLTTLRVVALSEGGVRRSFVDRPTIVYEERAEALESE